MESKRLLLAGLLVVFGLVMQSGTALAQKASDHDPRFEKLAKDLYPSAQKEGSLMVYTVWDVGHEGSCEPHLAKGFRGSQPHIGRGRDLS